MKNIDIKYFVNRHSIHNGDVMLFRGKRLLSRIIQWGDSKRNDEGKMQKAYYNHAGVVYKINHRLFIVDANAPGVQPEFLSARIRKNVDFCVIRPIGFAQETIDASVNIIINKSEEGIKYDVLLLPRILLSRKLRFNLQWGEERKDICSEFTGKRYLAQNLGVKCFQEGIEKQGYVTPQDHIRWAVVNEISILFDDSTKK